MMDVFICWYPHPEICNHRMSIKLYLTIIIIIIIIIDEQGGHCWKSYTKVTFLYILLDLILLHL